MEVVIGLNIVAATRLSFRVLNWCSDVGGWCSRCRAIVWKMQQIFDKGRDGTATKRWNESYKDGGNGRWHWQLHHVALLEDGRYIHSTISLLKAPATLDEDRRPPTCSITTWWNKQRWKHPYFEIVRHWDWWRELRMNYNMMLQFN